MLTEGIGENDVSMICPQNINKQPNITALTVSMQQNYILQCVRSFQRKGGKKIEETNKIIELGEKIDNK